MVALNAAEKSAAARTGARYINTVPWFCTSICSNVVGRFQPYWASYHINADYSFALGGCLTGHSTSVPSFRLMTEPSWSNQVKTWPRRLNRYNPTEPGAQWPNRSGILKVTWWLFPLRLRGVPSLAGPTC
jgi:hypothetical protein